MHRFKIKILIALCILLFYIPSYLFCQERLDAREEARQHYRQGQEFYSQGRYQEASSEFEKALDLIGPPKLEYMERLQKEQSKALAPTPALPKPTTPREKIKEKKKEGAETGVAKPSVTLAASPETKEPGEKEYYIDIGDVLDISVWQIPDLSRSEVIVRPDGKISFPLLGDIITEGLTITQLDELFTEKLKAYVKDPEVSIMIRRFGEQANKVVVLGEILSPGVYKFSGPPTIAEVIASAGGYTKYAVLNSIMIIRGDVKTKPEVQKVNLAQILKSGKLTQNVFLKPNDIVYVPRSFIGNVNTFMEILQPAINEYMQTLNARHLQEVVRSRGGI
jgi:polysaccharide export outer membrane protein